jgi:protein-histidine pros-kinase
LTSVLGNAEVMEELGPEELGPRARHYLEIISRNARRELRLVDDLLTMVGLDRTDFVVESEELSLSRVVQQSVEAAQPQADAAGVRVDLVVHDGPTVPGDPQRIAQAVDNLLANAIKFSKAGGVVEVTVRPAGEGADVVITDHGVGIAPADLPHVFDKLFRAPQVIAQQVPGVGLGLTIAQAIARTHRGSVSVESVEGRGSTFTLTLPGTPIRL